MREHTILYKKNKQINDIMSLLKADPSQFQLTETGAILFQKALNNPTLGDHVATLEKGDSIYTPKISLAESAHVAAAGKEEALNALNTWFKTHINTVLEPLKRLEDTIVLRKKEGSDDLEPVEMPQEAKDNAKSLMDKLYSHMGIVHRSELTADIQKLDEDARKILRAKRIKMGPILVFLPELNKPKGVRLRGLLWSLWNDQPLPAQLPSDGAVSIKVDPETINKELHLAVSYPVFGARAIRIDMLDRVINAIYETAKEGKFQAQHSMAEWLGCSIDDLYDVLSAMGHKRIIVEKTEEVLAPVSEEITKETVTEEKKSDVKPILDTFWLKKGQAHKSAYQKPFSNDKKKALSDKKPYKKKPQVKKNQPKKPINITIEADKRPEDNPFSILEQLKSK